MNTFFSLENDSYITCSTSLTGQVKGRGHRYSQTGCSVPPNIARLPSKLQCSCANCSEQVAPGLANCNYISFNKFVDFNTFLADFR